MTRKLLPGVGLVLAAVGFVAFVGLAVGVWPARREADRQVAAAAEKAHAAGDVAERVIGLIREVIARGQAGLAAARAEPPAPGGDPDPFVQVALWKARHDLPAEVERARDAVGTASEAVIVADAALAVFEGQPADDGTALGVRPEDMQSARTQLDAAAADLRTARRVLGIPIPTAGATPEQLATADAALSKAAAVADKFDAALARARGKVDGVRQKAEAWSLWAALGVTGLAALAALGQVFLARACWRGLRAG